MKEWWCWKHTCAQTSCFLGRRVLCWADKRTWWASPGLTVACCSGGMLASANKQPIQNINSLLSWSTFHSIFLQWDVTGAEIKTRLKIKKDPKQKRHKYFNVNKTFNKSDNIHALAFSYQTNKQTNSAVSIHRVVAMLMQMYTWSNTACDKKKKLYVMLYFCIRYHPQCNSIMLSIPLHALPAPSQSTLVSCQNRCLSTWQCADDQTAALCLKHNKHAMFTSRVSAVKVDVQQQTVAQ